jgi:hypothetical protein
MTKMTEEEDFEILRWCQVLARLGYWWWREDIIRGRRISSEKKT